MRRPVLSHGHKEARRLARTRRSKYRRMAKDMFQRQDQVMLSAQPPDPHRPPRQLLSIINNETEVPKLRGLRPTRRAVSHILCKPVVRNRNRARIEKTNEHAQANDKGEVYVYLYPDLLKQIPDFPPDDA